MKSSSLLTPLLFSLILFLGHSFLGHAGEAASTSRVRVTVETVAGEVEGYLVGLTRGRSPTLDLVEKKIPLRDVLRISLSVPSRSHRMVDVHLSDGGSLRGDLTDCRR